MGYSLSILVWDMADFPRVASNFGWAIGGEFDPNAGMLRHVPPLATAGVNRRQLVFVNHKSLRAATLLDVRRISEVAPTLHFWVNDTSGATNFSGHANGSDLWAVWAVDDEYHVEGEPPFDVQSFVEMVTDESEHARLEYGDDEGEVDWYRLPVRAFEAVVGVTHSGNWPRPCFFMSGEIPLVG